MSVKEKLVVIRRLRWLTALLLCGFAGLASAAEALPRHPLETRALVEPEAVLKELPAAIEAARSAGDQRTLTLLYLAEANACRVVADWLCQRNAGARARETAQPLGETLLLVRGLIAESRASIALQDYTRGERLLGDAELKLKQTPNAELEADVLLAYSSLSHTLGKHQLAADYAERGLQRLDRGEALPMQARLLRNRARALAQLGQFEAAQQSLLRGMAVVEQVTDPKLSAELYLEAARVARLLNDVGTQRQNGQKVLELARQLKNSQLAGLGHEVLGIAALNAGDDATALAELKQSYDSFRALGLARDELRLSRQLIGVMVEQPQLAADLEPLVRRFLELDRTVAQSDRAQAADDFDARLKYAQQELEVLRLENEATLAREREEALARTNRLTRLLILVGATSLTVLAIFFWQQWRSNRRLKAAFAALRDSEARATDLLKLSKGFVFLHDAQGHLLLVNPATAAALGAAPEDLEERALADFVPSAGHSGLKDYLARVSADGEDEGRLLVRQGDGSHHHWRYSSRLSAQADRRAYVIAHAVDVTEQVEQAELLREKSRRDALTGAYNRRQLEEIEARPDSAGAPRQWAVVNVDLDHFKQINDSRGHDVGDQVLREMARLLERAGGAGSTLIRTGGDEFVLLNEPADTATLAALLERLESQRAGAPCGYSLGSALRHGDETLSATLTRADEDMYQRRRLARGEK